MLANILVMEKVEGAVEVKTKEVEVEVKTEEVEIEVKKKVESKEEDKICLIFIKNKLNTNKL